MPVDSKVRPSPGCPQVDHEAHLPAEQPPPREDPRLPFPHEDQEWPLGAQASPRQGPARPGPLSTVCPVEFRGAFRTLQRGEISAPPKGLRSLLGREARLDVRRFPGPPEPMGPRLLVNAPRRAGSAVERNRFRRRVRMAFLALIRDERLTPNPGSVLWVRPGSAGCALAFDEVLDLLRQALSRPDRA